MYLNEQSINEFGRQYGLTEGDVQKVIGILTRIGGFVWRSSVADAVGRVVGGATCANVQCEECKHRRVCIIYKTKDATDKMTRQMAIDEIYTILRNEDQKYVAIVIHMVMEADLNNHIVRDIGSRQALGAILEGLTESMNKRNGQKEEDDGE